MHLYYFFYYNLQMHNYIIKVYITTVHSFIHSFILHSVNPYKVINNLEDIELVLLLIQ